MLVDLVVGLCQSDPGHDICNSYKMECLHRCVRAEVCGRDCVCADELWGWKGMQLCGREWNIVLFRSSSVFTMV